MEEEAKVKEILENILKTSDVGAALELFYDFENEEISEFFEENEETFVKLIDSYIDEKVLTIGQLYCLILIRFEDEKYNFIPFLGTIKGKNKKSAQLLEILLNMINIESDEIDDFENNISVLEKAIEEYAKNLS